MTNTTYTRYSASCLSCKSEITTNNFSKHINSKQCNAGGKFKYNSAGYTPRTTLICKFCDKVGKSINSIAQHEIRCKLNPDKIKPIDYTPRTYKTIDPTPCKYCQLLFTSPGGLKNHECRCPKNPNQELQVISEEGKRLGKIKSAAKAETYWLNEENKTAACIRMQNAVLNNPESYMHTDRGRTKEYRYNGIRLQGKWELDFYKWAELHLINICRSNEWFTYTYKDNTHRYNPDFYLSEFDMYVEVKGYETERDRLKWKYLTHEHNKILCIIDKRSIIRIKNNTITLQELMDNYIHK